MTIEELSTHKQYTEPIFERLADYRATLTSHPLLTAARDGELPEPILRRFAFYQYSDSILWIPMLAQMKSRAARSRRLRQAIEDNIKHEAGVGPPNKPSHVTLAVAMMRSLGIRSLETFMKMPTLPRGSGRQRRRRGDGNSKRETKTETSLVVATSAASPFTTSATLWLSDEFASFTEPELAGWLLTAETLVPLMFDAFVSSFEAIRGCDTTYFREHVDVDSDEHSAWMAEAVLDVISIYGPECVPEIVSGMQDAWEETREVPDTLWDSCANVSTSARGLKSGKKKKSEKRPCASP